MAERVLDDVLAYPHESVVGIGIDGPEDQGPPERFAPVFQRAGRAGLKRTAHVCEDYAPTPATNYVVCRKPARQQGALQPPSGKETCP